MSFCAVVGAQFGSEGKGLLVGEIAREYDAHVRVGAANAGHTVYTTNTQCDQCGGWWTTKGSHSCGNTDEGKQHEKHVMQQLPCAAYANPDAELIVGPGALISLEILHQEIATNQQWRSERGLEPALIRIDRRAQIIRAEHVIREQESDLAARIGSTSTIAKEGIGAAQAARVMREAGCIEAGSLETGLQGISIGNMPLVMRAMTEFAGQRILLEGTQGTGLSLTTGYFPYVTSRNTTTAGLCADAGVPVGAVDRVILVCRSYPIRVAGNSGPWGPGSQEIDWSSLGIDQEKERTTVTKKVRRVATFSMDQIVEACWLNSATEIALTFADYLDPQIYGCEGSWNSIDWRGFHKTVELINNIEAATSVPVTFVGTGPHSTIRRG